MKELSIEQKAKAYDEAIEKLRNFYRDYDTVSRLIDVKEELANLFPQLKESEDERIRKEMIEILKQEAKDFPSSIIAEKSNKWIAWLEKQGEHQKFRNSIQVGDKVTRNKNGVLVNLSQLDRVAKQGEKGTNGNNREIPNSDWSEEDEIGLGDALWAIQQARTIAKDENDMGNLWYAEKWLKSLKDRYAWFPSEEQIKVCKKVYADILSAKGFDLGTVNSELNRLEEELKELKAQKGEKV